MNIKCPALVEAGHFDRFGGGEACLNREKGNHWLKLP